MRKNLFVLFFIISVGAEGQVTFVKLYSNGAPHWPQPFIKTFDGNLLFSGYYYNSYLTKTDQEGNILWSKEFLMQGSEVVEAIKPTKDSCYLLAGSVDSVSGNTTDRKLFLLKVDFNGSFLWIKIYDNVGGGITGLFETADSGFFVPTQNFLDPTLVRTDKDGDTLWTKILTSAGFIKSTYGTFDGGYIISGYKVTGEIFLIKMDSSGNIIWSKNYSMTGDPFSVLQSSDSGYIVTGCINCQSFSTDGFIIKTNVSGDIVWAKIFFSPIREIGLSIIETAPLGFAITGFLSDTTGHGTFLIKLNSNGDTLWTATYPVMSGGVSLLNADDGGFLISIQHDMGNLWGLGLIKTDEFGLTDCSEYYKSLIFQDTILQTTNSTVSILNASTNIVTIPVQQNINVTNISTVCYSTEVRDEIKNDPIQISLYPNPFHTSTVLKIITSLVPEYLEEKAQLKIFNSMGVLVRTEQIPKSASYILHRSGLIDGFYFYELQNHDGGMIGTGKFVID